MRAEVGMAWEWIDRVIAAASRPLRSLADNGGSSPGSEYRGVDDHLWSRPAPIFPPPGSRCGCRRFGAGGISAAPVRAPQYAIDNVEGYLFATAHNVLVSRYREQSARAALLHDEWVEGRETADPLSPERIAIGQEEYRRVVTAIRNLPPRTREAFELHRFENLTYHAIAQRMGIGRESVKDLMHRALVRIAEEMEAGR